MEFDSKKEETETSPGSFLVVCQPGQTVDALIADINGFWETSGGSGIYSVKCPRRDKGRDWVNFSLSKSASKQDAAWALSEVDDFLLKERQYVRQWSPWGAPRYEPMPREDGMLDPNRNVSGCASREFDGPLKFQVDKKTRDSLRRGDESVQTETLAAVLKDSATG